MKNLVDPPLKSFVTEAGHTFKVGRGDYTVRSEDTAQAYPIVSNGWVVGFLLWMRDRRWRATNDLHFLFGDVAYRAPNWTMHETQGATIEEALTGWANRADAFLEFHAAEGRKPRAYTGKPRRL